MKTAALQDPVNTSKASSPGRVTAEIMLTVVRSPVLVTTGVRPGGAGVVVGTERGLVDEVQGSALGFRLHSDRGELLLFPPAHLFRILLIGAVQRPLRRHADPRQQPPDRYPRQVDAELGQDKLPHQVTRPQRVFQPHLAGRAVEDERVQPRQMLISKLRRPSRRRGNHQRVNAASPIQCLPLEHGRPLGPQRRHHVGVVRAVPEHANSLHPQGLQHATAQPFLRHGATLSEEQPKAY